MRTAGLLCGLGLAFAAGCRSGPHAGSLAELEPVDLSHAFDSRTLYWPTDLHGFQLEVLSAGITPGGYYYSANRFCSAEHGGTHLDAPMHFAEDRPGVDGVPLARLIAPAVAVDVSGQVAADRDYRVRVADLEAWEAEHGRIPAASIVLLRTGYASHWGDRGRYLGTALRGPEAVAQLHFPGLHPDAAEWLVRERHIAAVGIDTASIDHGPSSGFEAHRILAAADVPALENLAALDTLPARGFWLLALPMKIAGGSGGPLRAVALLPGRARRTP
jgi:kynurenine formamidase